MEKFLKKGHYIIISQFYAIQAFETPSQSIHLDMQFIFSKHDLVFETPQDLSPSFGAHNNSLPLIPSSLSPNVRPYRHPFSQKNEIENIVQELLAMGVIHHSTNPYSSPIFMVLKKEGIWCMRHDFHSLNRITIKDTFSIPVNDDLLDELKSAQFFTKLHLCFGYHQIHMKEVDIHKLIFTLMNSIMSYW
jgi:hypothetical protein